MAHRQEQAGDSIIGQNDAIGDICQGSQYWARSVGLESSNASVAKQELAESCRMITAETFRKPVGKMARRAWQVRFGFGNDSKIKHQHPVDQDSCLADKIVRFVVVKVAVISPYNVPIVFGMDIFFTHQKRMAQAVFDVFEFTKSLESEYSFVRAIPFYSQSVSGPFGHAVDRIILPFTILLVIPPVHRIIGHRSMAG